MTRRITYTIDLSPEAWLALERHGYDPLLPPRGLPGPPGRLNGFTQWVDKTPVHLPLRNHVCRLDGIEVDGHMFSDIDPGWCIGCGDYVETEDEDDE